MRIAAVLLALMLAVPSLSAQSPPDKGNAGQAEVAAWLAALRGGSGAELARAQRGFAKAGATAAGASLAPLTALLRDGTPTARAAAAGALGALGPSGREATPALVAALSDPSPAVRAEAAWALPAIARGAKEPVPAALIDAATDSSPLVVIRAIAAFAEFITPMSLLPRIDALLADSVQDRRIVALRLLRKLSDVNVAVARYTAVLDGNDQALRFEAAWALERLGPSAAAALPRLERLHGDSSADMREAVDDAIHAIRGPVATVVLPSGAAACGHRPIDRSIPLMLTVLPGSVSLRDDGRGAYGTDPGTRSDNSHAYSLRLPYAYGADVQARKAAESAGGRKPARWLALDLTTPVPGSGARALGIVRDSAAFFATFHMLDANRAIWNVRDIPVGGVVPSDRTEIGIHINGAWHYLELGPWSLGQCAEGYADGGVLNGEGTTPVRITRTSELEYVVETLPGSVARLWDIRQMSKPVDVGLYHVSFRVRLTPLPQ
jgi:HEAT repeat protein